MRFSTYLKDRDPENQFAMYPLETNRLRLREFTENDSPFILELLNTDGWIRYIGDRKINSLDTAKKYLIDGPIKSYTQYGFGLSMVELSDEKTPVGMCGLIKRDSLEDFDLGFAFLPEFTGKGYAFEIADACLNFAFHELKLNRVVAITLPENTACVSLLKKLGMRFEKTVTLPNDTVALSLFATQKKSTTRPPFIEFPALKSDRIILREIRYDEAPGILEILYYNQKNASDVNEAIQILKKVDFNYRNGSGVNWGIVIPDTGEIAGTIGYYRGFEDNTGEIGFVTKEKFRRKGFTFHAVQLLTEFGYSKMNLQKIIAYTNPDNVASQNLLKKTGFVQTNDSDNRNIRFEHQKR